MYNNLTAVLENFWPNSTFKIEVISKNVGNEFSKIFYAVLLQVIASLVGTLNAQLKAFATVRIPVVVSPEAITTAVISSAEICSIDVPMRPNNKTLTYHVITF